MLGIPKQNHEITDSRIRATIIEAQQEWESYHGEIIGFLFDAWDRASQSSSTLVEESETARDLLDSMVDLLDAVAKVVADPRPHNMAKLAKRLEFYANNPAYIKDIITKMERAENAVTDHPDMLPDLLDQPPAPEEWSLYP